MRIYSAIVDLNGLPVFVVDRPNALGGNGRAVRVLPDNTLVLTIVKTLSVAGIALEGTDQYARACAMAPEIPPV